ncbi:hypothetical protein TNCV_3763331 [Trichonephila clavipes]|uniref:Uncharacterized protein n=1 Tax=Trichonephila clavipes TaxID=2585209 RepID=A0A8X6VV49_TRICX|nr:hypothetical protein TNCV_3763331 [Trichonephila clavipes]
MIEVCNEVLRNFKTLGLECNQLAELLLVFSLQDKLEDSIKVKRELTLEDNKVAAYTTKRVELQLSPHFSQDIFAVNALVVKEFTCNLPNFIVSKFD